MSNYDNWRCTDLISEQNAEYDVRLEAKTRQIRENMVVTDYWLEIEESLSGTPEFSVAVMTCAAGNHEAGGEMIKKLADKWIDKRAAEMAVNSLAGGDNE